MNRREQLSILEKAKDRVLAWANGEAIDLFQVDFVVGFGQDFGVSTWFFYKTDDEVRAYNADGTSRRVAQQFIEILSSFRYDFTKSPEPVGFFYDSDENVQKNYEGSYFYRLR